MMITRFFPLFLASAVSCSAATVFLAPTAATTVSGYTATSRPVDNMIDGSGLNTWDETGIHIAGGGVEWQGRGNVGVVQFDLGAEYEVSSFYLWNQEIASGAVDNFRVEFLASDTTPLYISGTLLATTNGVANSSMAVQQFALTPTNNVRFVKLYIDSLHSNVDNLAIIGEVGFEVTLVPEPSSSLLLGLGGLGFMLRRKRS